MRIALVCGDGLPVSGLLTIFRNVLDVGRELGVVDLPLPVDFGYSWRPDKPGFFPAGGAAIGNPEWVLPSNIAPPENLDDWASELVFIRDAVAAYQTLTTAQRDRLRARIKRIEEVYHEYFSRWLKQHDVDSVIALNMTLSDAVPVTEALHRAVEDRYAGGRPGGIVFHDHDLFASCAIPTAARGCTRPSPTSSRRCPSATRGPVGWSSPRRSPTRPSSIRPTQPIVLGNILPQLPVADLAAHHVEFMRRHKLSLDRPVLLDPVRVFQVKGVDVALRLLAAAKDSARRRGAAAPLLLVFGSLKEDPDYAAEVLHLAHALNLQGDVRFLDGVPLSTHADAHGHWQLDEIDLLRLASATGGAVVFTPGVHDVETVGLGPALAAAAGLPCAVTDYDAFDGVYQRRQQFSYVRVGTSPPEILAAGEELLDTLARVSAQDPELAVRLGVNQRIIGEQFPTGPWRTLWRELAAACGQQALAAD